MRVLGPPVDVIAESYPLYSKEDQDIDRVLTIEFRPSLGTLTNQYSHLFWTCLDSILSHDTIIKQKCQATVWSAQENYYIVINNLTTILLSSITLFFSIGDFVLIPPKQSQSGEKHSNIIETYIKPNRQRW